MEDVQENGQGPGKHADGDSDWVAIQVVGQEGMIRRSGGGGVEEAATGSAGCTDTEAMGNTGDLPTV